MSPYLYNSYYAFMYFVIAVAILTYCDCVHHPSVDISVLNDNDDWVLYEKQLRHNYGAINKRQSSVGRTQQRLEVENDIPKHYKFALQRQANERQRNRLGQNGQGRQACQTTVPVPMRLVFGISKNGSEVEIQPGQVFMVVECENERASCYGFSNDRLSSSCETHYTSQYAFVRLKGSGMAWSLDHILVASGCLCYISERPALSAEEEWVLEP